MRNKKEFETGNGQKWETIPLQETSFSNKNKKNKRIQTQFDTISIVFNKKQKKYQKYRNKKDAIQHDRKNRNINRKIDIWKQKRCLLKWARMTIQDQIRYIVPPLPRPMGFGADLHFTQEFLRVAQWHTQAQTEGTHFISFKAREVKQLRKYLQGEFHKQVTAKEQSCKNLIWYIWHFYLYMEISLQIRLRRTVEGGQLHQLWLKSADLKIDLG